MNMKTIKPDDAPFKKQFGEKFKSARKAAGLTQQDTAQALGVERSSIAKYESGAAVPGISNLPSICKVLNIPIDELISFE